MRRLTATILGVLAAATVGCSDLGVENNNSPDRDRALARPTDVEGLAAAQYRIIHNALWATGGIHPQLAVMGMESFSTNANFGMGVRSGIPRSLIDNGRGNPADFYATWLSLLQAARTEALALERLNLSSFTFFPASAAQTLRARAFGYFVKGVALGYVAMMFDSGPVVQPGDDIEITNPLVSYDSLMRVAIADLDMAIALASTTPAPTGINGFPIPTTVWTSTPSISLTGGAAGNFVRWANTYKARFRAGVARTPAERAAVNWPQVITDATAGLLTDMSMTMVNASGGWSYAPVQMNTFQSWHQMWAGIMGMADTSGGYQTWLNTSRNNKVPFTVVTSDLRFPQGLDRPAQNASSGCVTGTTCTPAAGQYYRNRLPGQDVGVDGLFFSFYDFHRYQLYYAPGGQNGPIVEFPRAEMDMLIAEGHIRAGNFPAAMAAINPSRVAHGLPALAGITSINDPVTGSAAGCIPKVPTGATNATNGTPTTVACGNIMEAMKHEKRHETAFNVPGGWYYDARGWGDLPFNTPIHFPVPYTELDARGQVIYSAPTVNVSAGVYSAAERFSNSASSYGFGN